MNVQSKQLGFTLVELMIALTLGLIVTAAAVQLILGSFITTRLQEANSQIQDSGLFGIDYIVKDIQMLNFGNSNQYEIKSNTPRGGVVLTAGFATSISFVASAGSAAITVVGVGVFASQTSDNVLPSSLKK